MYMKKISYLFIMILFSTLALSKDYYFITGINNNKIETGITVSTASLDEDDDDMFFTIGYNYSVNLGIDISFFETGDATLSGDNGDRFTLEGTEYEFIPEDKNVISATTDYSSNIVCSVEKENIFGTQFHPEKSDKIGLKIIENFMRL